MTAISGIASASTKAVFVCVCMVISRPLVLCRADLQLQASGSSGIFVLLLRVALVSLFAVCALLVCSCSLVYIRVLLPGFALFG